MNVWTIRREQDGDEAAIAHVIAAAFAGVEWSDGSEAAIVERLRDSLELESPYDAAGCVVLGDPGYYVRFSFAHDPALTYPAASVPEYFQRLVLGGEPLCGVVSYSPAFG